MATWRVQVESVAGTQPLWYRLEDGFADLLTGFSDGAVVALLVPAMAAGEDIHVDGTLSARLLYNLSGPFQKLLRRIMPSLNEIRIHSRSIEADPPRRAEGVASGFSGGVDSFCVLADHHHADVPKAFRLTHLLFNNVGSHGSGGERLFRERYERLQPTAQRIGLPFLAIDSNLDTFYGKRLKFQQTHTLRNASVAMLLQGGVGRCLYASGVDYSKVFVGPAHDTAFSDVVTLPMLSTDTVEILSVGSEYTRVQKTLRVTEVPASWGSLDVCVNSRNTSGRTNCSTCWKCLRTMATLEVAGCLDRYAQSFDLEAYGRWRKAYFASLLGSRDPLLKEIVQFARERDYTFPFSSRLLHRSGVSSLAMLSRRARHKLERLAGRAG